MEGLSLNTIQMGMVKFWFPILIDILVIVQSLFSLSQ
jgi:hypothetical protein